MTEQLTREVILMDRIEEIGDDGLPIIQEVTRFNLTEEQFGNCAIIKWKSDYYVFSPKIWDVHQVVAFVKNGILRL